jgi:malonate transporter and related proteins
VVVLRSLIHPALTALVGSLLGLPAPALLAVVTMASLPTAQNVLVFALHYGRRQDLARDAGLVTTVLTVPLMLVVAATLG